MMDQISVGREDILRKLHKMKKKNKKIPCNNKNKFIKKRYIVLFILMTILGLCYFNKDFFMEYIHHKIDRLSTNLISKLKLQDVKYLLENTENHDKISMIVTGKILNEDDLVLKVRGVRVVVYDQNNVEIVSWDDNIKEGFIVSGDVVDFRTIHDIPRFSGNIRVDVSLI